MYSLKRYYHRAHRVNTRYFKKIDTEEKAYWLGFISADGYVSERKTTYSVQIALKKSDRAHLLKFKKSIGYSGPIRYLEKTKAYSLTIYSREIAEDLVKLGVRQNKSLTIKSWNGPKKYMRHYWRGVFDGDGYFIVTRKKRKNGNIYLSWLSGLVGNRSMVKSFRAYVIKNSESKYKKGHFLNCGNVARVTFPGIRPSKVIAQLLYIKASVYLDRKKELSEKILVTKMCDPIIRHYSMLYLQKIYRKLKTWKNVSKFIGVSRPGLCKHIKKHSRSLFDYRKSTSIRRVNSKIVPNGVNKKMMKKYGPESL